MNAEKFSALMPIIIGDLAKKIVKEERISESEAIDKIYGSKLYALLEQEDTKLWHYSTAMLYSLLEEEIRTGKITFPDV